jgi:hypothetical protein
VQEKLQAWLKRARDRLSYQKNLETTRRRLLMPDSRNRALWDAFNLALMTWTIFEIPFSILFNDQMQECSWSAMMIINLFVDCLFLFDMAVTMNTAYYDPEGLLVEERKIIFENYLKGWLMIDLTTSLPIDVFICIFDTEGGDKLVLRVIKVCRFLKLARMLKFLKILKKWEIASGSKTVRSLIRISKLLSFMLYSTHLAACAWMSMVLVTRECFEQDIYQGIRSSPLLLTSPLNPRLSFWLTLVSFTHLYNNRRMHVLRWHHRHRQRVFEQELDDGLRPHTRKRNF